jgi:predicted nucleotidyltransferase
MMPLTRPASTAALSLRDLIARLAANEVVEGVLLMGSTGQGALNVASDLDLLVVMSKLDEPLALVHTTIERRLAEIYFVLSATLDPILAPAQGSVSGGSLPHSSEQVALYTWIQSGQIVADRSGRLTRAQQMLQTTAWFTPASDEQRYRIWFGSNYNLQHTLWVAQSPEPRYQREVDVRLLYTVFFLVCDYFHLRGLPWQGSKAAMRWLAQHDPAYHALFLGFLDAGERARKLAIYAELVERTLAPYGPCWPTEATAIQFTAGSPVSAAAQERGLAWWEALIDPATGAL